MGCNKDEAARAKALAERKLLDKDFAGAKKLIIKAQQFSKEVGDIDIPKMLTVCDVHCAAGAKENWQIDWYGILQVPETADDTQIKKQYHKLALLLHPDKNKFGGAETAFKLVGEANETLTDMSKRSLYDMKRVRATQRTFWTMCPSCGTIYQYYISALEKTVCCLNQNCLKQFIACDLTEQADPYEAKQRSARAVVESSESSKSESSSDNEEERVVVESSEANISETNSDNEEEGAVVESSESSISEASSDSEEEIADHGPAVNGSAQGQQNRQMQEVMYNEEKVDDDFVNSPRLKRLRKSGMFCGDDNKQTTKLVEEIAGHNGMTDDANTYSTTEDEREGCTSMHGVELGTDDASDVVPQGDTLRFSHYVPHHVVGGTEKEGILEKSLELDPAALFHDLEEDFLSIAQVVSTTHGTAVHDLMEQGVPSGANQQYAGVWKNAGVPQKSPGLQTNVTAQKAWSATPGLNLNVASRHAGQNTKRETAADTAGPQDNMKSDHAARNPSKASSTVGLKRRRRAVVETSESSTSETNSDCEKEVAEHGLAANGSGLGQRTRRSRWKKDKNDDDDDVLNDKVDDFVNSPGLKRLRKSFMFHGDHSNKATNLNKETAGHNGLTNGVNICSNTEKKKIGAYAPCGENSFNKIQQMERETMHGGENGDGKENEFDSGRSNGPGLNNEDEDAAGGGGGGDEHEDKDEDGQDDEAGGTGSAFCGGSTVYLRGPATLPECPLPHRRPVIRPEGANDKAKKVTSGKRKKGSTSKRRRSGNDDDMDWNPNPDLDVDEEEESDDEEMDVSSYRGIGRKWDFSSYERARSPYQYEKARDATLPFFHTKVQEDAYFGYIRGATIHKHQYMNMTFLMEKDVAAGLLDNLHHIGLYEFLEHKCDYNDLVVRQFYATMEIKIDINEIEWMTGKRRYAATFDEFAEANKIIYGSLKDAIDLDEEDVLAEDQRRQFYEPVQDPAHPFRIGNPRGLRHHPALINKIARLTFIPKGGNKDAIRDKFWNVFDHIMYRQKFDVVKFMMTQLAVLKHDMTTNLYFAPYIMSLILMKTRFKGECGVQHTSFKPYLNEPRFYERPLTPFPSVEEEEQMRGDDDHGQPHMEPHMEPQGHGWAPPAGYFDSYFQNMQASWNTSFAKLGDSIQQQIQQGFHTMGQQWQSHMDSSFQQFGQHLHSTMYEPIMTSLQNVQQGLHSDIDALSAQAAQLGTLSTQEQFQQLQNRQDQLEQRVDVMNTKFNDFSDHFNMIYPRPAPPPAQYPYMPFYPPQFYPPPDVGEGQHTPFMNAGIAAETPKEDNRKHNTCSAEVTDVDEVNILQTEYVYVESEFYDFSQIKLLQKISPGQIWALYSNVDKFPNYYGFIQKVDLNNGKVQVRWLDVCPRGEEEKRWLQEGQTIGCGTFRLSTVDRLMTCNDTAAFSHCVEARSAGQKGEYEIIPHLGEIWAVYKNWRAGWTAQDFGRCGYELVEILGQTASSIRVQLLRKVDGYRLVFMPYGGEGSVKTIWKNEYPRFSHQIPCFRLTREKGGKLQGWLELDPSSLPEEFLNCR